MVVSVQQEVDQKFFDKIFFARNFFHEIFTRFFQFGSLIVTVDVAFPKTELTQEQKEVIRTMLNQKDVDPDFYNGIKFPRKKS